MVNSGLWHGSATTFVIWGALHGVGVIVLNLKQRLLPEQSISSPIRAFINRNFARIICFHFVCLAWVFFRSESLDSALLILQQIGNLHLHSLLENYAYELLAVALLFFSYPLLVKFTERLQIRSEQASWWYYPLILAIVLSIAFSLSPDGMPNFIYASF